MQEKSSGIQISIPSQTLPTITFSTIIPEHRFLCFIAVFGASNCQKPHPAWPFAEDSCAGLSKSFKMWKFVSPKTASRWQGECCNSGEGRFWGVRKALGEDRPIVILLNTKADARIGQGRESGMNETSVRLGPRERQITELLLQGCDNTEIAKQLNMAQRTVKAHFNRLFLRFGISGGIKRVKLATLLYRRQLCLETTATESIPKSTRAACHRPRCPGT